MRLFCSPISNRTLIFHALCIALLFLLAHGRSHAQAFSLNTTATLPGLTNGTLVWGDYDADGDLDALVSGLATFTTVYRNDGSTYTDIGANLLFGFIACDAAWGDYDADGDLDILIAGRIGGGSRICRIYNNSGGSFSDIGAGLEGAENSAVAWGDYDSDGDLDVLYCGSNGSAHITKLYRNDAGNFTDINTGIVSISDGDVAFGDYDSDGDLDILAAGRQFPSNDLTTLLYRNNGGVFTELNVGLPGVYGGAGGNASVAWGDYDADGDLDILLTGHTGSAIVANVYRNDAGSFTDINAGLHGIGEGMAVWGDYDSDGDPDILLSGRGAGDVIATNVYRNDAGSFTDINAGLPPVFDSNLAWGDNDNDGDLDILFSGYNNGSSSTQIWTNNTTTANTAPTAPTGLSVSDFTLSTAQLSWNRASDAQTPQVGLSYNLMIGTTTAGINIQSPMASVTTGQRHIVASGAVNNTTSTVFSNLIVGLTYYWSVQAIDAGYAGSPFATGGSFTFVPAFEQAMATGLPAVAYGSIEWGDYDSDGDLDVLIAGQDSTLSDQTGIYQNNGGIFTDIGAGLPGVNDGSATWIDYDADGDLDIFLTGYQYDAAANISEIYRNDGGGVFATINAGLVPMYASAGLWSDYDQDGDPDLLLAGRDGGGNGSNYIYRNDGAGVFTDINAGLAGITGTAAWGDYDSDGDPDILLSGMDNGASRYTIVYRNDAGIFTDINAGLPGTSYGTTEWGDYDSDGDLDILLTGDGGSDFISNLYRNDGGTFTDINAGLVPLQHASAAWGDYDNDGDADLALSGQDANLDRRSLVYENKLSTAQGFVSIGSGLLAMSHGDVAWGDYDNDGDLDLVLSGEADVPGGFALELWVNNTTRANTVPDVPTGLRISNITMTGVELAWDRATDSQTPQAAMSYNLALSTTTAGVQAAMADVTTGYRQVVAPGNEQFATTAQIDGLVPGETYYWSVQAIDGAYAGSAFAPLDSFVYQPLLVNIGDAGISAVEGGDLEWGDYDNDGDLDLVIIGSDRTQHISRIYRNDSGNFVDINAGLTGVVDGAVTWGDYDNDGDLDIALLGRTYPSNAKESHIYRNDNGTFTDINAGLAGVEGGTLAWGDYDNDGDLDLVIIGEYTSSNYQAFLYRNDGGSFTSVSNIGLDGGALASAAWGDYDNDGDLDLLLSISNGTGDYVEVYRNNRGSFNAINANMSGLIDGSVDWGDYDNDGNLDILATGSAQSLIYRNIGHNDFANINAGLAGSYLGFGKWGDYDNDGDLDILQTGNSTYSGPAIGYIYTNTGGSFSPIPITPVTSSVGAWGDYDADGDLDFVFTGVDSTNTLITQVWKNNSLKYINTPPTAPVLNTPESGLESVQLSWSRATDNETPQLSLNYNLVIGTTTSNISIMSPMADVTTGYRRVVAIGPQQTTATKIYDLVPGTTYYWSVQAIDGAFEGGPFATTGSFLYQPPFRQVTTAGLEGLENCAVTWGDYDSDGDLDLFMAGSNGVTHVSRIYRNNGGGSFTDINAGLPGVSEAGAAWGDYDSDGDLDLAFGGRFHPSNAEYNLIYRNDNGVFTSLGNFLTGGRYSSFSWGDYDNDGDLDLLLSATQSTVEFTHLYRNDGGSFTMLNISSMVEWAAYGDIAWGDYDNDGDPDLLQTGYSINNYRVSRVYRNDGGTLTNINAGLTAVDYASAAWGDYDNDGDLDIVLSGDAGSMYVTHVYRNDGGTFTNINADLVGCSEGSVAWGDYDNDGDLDILLSGSNSTRSFTYVYRNDGGSFQLAVELPEVDRSAAVWGDYDNDGDLDLVMAGNQFISSSFKAQLWENLATTANTVPSAPTGLAVSNSNLDDIRFSWNRATDNETPQAGLSYNLMIGTTSAGISVQSPMADVTTGYRRVVELGSEQQTTATIIRGLVPGQTYYWGVQAVDGAFAGSTFATSSFVYQPTLTLSTMASLPGLQRGIAEWGDYDADGDMDILLAGETGAGNIFRIYRNDAGSFTDINAGFPGLTDPDAAWGDYDNDGDLDLVLTGQNGNARINTVYRNDGGSFTNINTDFRLLGITGLIQASVEWGDVDNDGQLDVLISGWSPGQITGSFVFRNDNGNFNYTGSYYWGGIDGSASFADYDNDGDLDFAFIGSTNRGLYTNNSHGSFSLSVFGFSTASTATWGDYDNDGDPDLLYTAASGSFIMRNGGGTVAEAGFANPGFSFPGVSESSGEWGDLDNDGDLDILLTGNNGGTRITRIYRNDGGTFTDMGGPLPGVSDGGGRWGDYDNDGDLDIVLTGVDNGSNPITQVWINNLAANGNTNDAPSAPTGLTLVSSDPYNVVLTWNPASDAETPQAGLTYNMYIGTSATVSEHTPMASITTGTRYVPERGGEQQVTTARIRALKGNTTYYWGVQAIDAGYKGSTFATGSFYYNPPFQSVVAMGGLWYGEVVWGDYDGDNDLDFVMSGNNGGADEVRVLRNNDGTGNVTGIGSGIAGLNQSSLAFGDYSNDNRIDLLVSGLENGSTPVSRIYYNQGGGGFADINAGLEGVYEGSAAWADYDNDGDLDLALTGNTGSGYTSLIYRSDAGTFTNINAALTGVAKSSVAWGDYDNDGDPDLLVAGSEDSSTASTRIYRNDAGIFTDINAGLPGVRESSVAWGDYDADGDLDILLAGAGNATRITRVYRNNGGSFANINAALTGVAEGSAAWGDYDNDGDLDILLTGVDSGSVYRTSVYRNDGGTTFQEIDADLPQVGHGSAAWGDYDNDGAIDILMSGHFMPASGIFWEIWKNMSTTANTSPNAPTGLTMSLGATSATLSWNKATDGQTPQDGLSYNLYIGTVNPGGEKQSPMADMTNGYRFIPAMGQERKTTSAVITGLTPGITYYWGVQAIDGAFAGSEFAVGDTIHINVPPQVSVTEATISALEDVPHLLFASVYDFDNAPYELIVTATSSNQSVLPDANITQGATAATTAFYVTPATNTTGTTVVTITVTDPKGEVATTSLTITFEPVNDAPYFTPGIGEFTLSDEAGPQTEANWATGMGTGYGASEADQSLEFILTADKPGLFTVQPAISSTGTLTFDPAPLAFGLRDTAVVSVYLKDNGGTANGGIDTTTTTTFTIILVSPNEAPLFATGATVIAYDEDGFRVLPNFLTSISPGSPNESYQNVEFHVSNSRPGVFIQQPLISPTGELTFTPRPGSTATVTVTVYATDDGGTEDGGVNTSTTQTFTINLGLTPVTRLVASVFPSSQVQSGQELIFIVRPTTPKGTWRSTTASTPLELQYGLPYLHLQFGLLDEPLPANMPPQQAHAVLFAMFFNSSTANITVPLTVADPRGILASTTAMVTINHAVPSALQVVTTNNRSVTLSWTPPAAQYIGGYAILRGTTTSSLAEIGTSLTTSYTDTTPENGETYYYGVKSYSEALTDPMTTEVYIRSGMSSLVSATVPKIIVTTPNGSERWEVATFNEIRWNTITTIATVGIEYSADNGATWIPVATATPNYGVYNMFVPSPGSTQAIVRVYDVARPLVVGTSSTFTTLPIAPVTSLTASALIDAVQLEWTPSTRSAVPGVSTYELYQRLSTTGTRMAFGSTYASDSTSYTDLGLEDGMTRYYSVRVNVAGQLSEFSPEIAITPNTMQVLSPEGGEVYQPGTVQTIIWRYGGDITAVALEYSVDDGQTWIPISQTVTSAGNKPPTTFYHNWIVPNTPTTTALVRVVSLSPVSFSRQSWPFAISTFAPAADLVATAGASSIELEWTASTAATVTGYRVLRGTTTSSLSAIANLGVVTSYEDTSANACVQYYYAVQTLAGNAASASSNVASATVLLPESIAVTSPNGGEVWQVGTTHMITWTSTSCTVAANVTIEYSKNNGVNWTALATTANTGSYAWTPNDPSSDEVLIRISGGAVIDVSDAVFRVVPVPPPANLVAVAGSQDIALTWTASTGQNISGYEVWRGSASGSLSLVTSVGMTTSYTDNTADACGAYYYAVKAMAGANTSAFSNETSATITLPESITLIAPNGGEVWQVGTNRLVIWTSTGCTVPGMVTIEYSIDNGANWSVIATTATTGDAFVWTPGNTPTTEARVRITGSALTDNSDAVFTIAPIPAPSDLAATSGSSTVDLTWTASTAQSLSGYEVWRGPTSGSLSLLASVSSATTTYADNSVTNCNAYVYAVRAMVGAFVSAFSNEATATPQITPAITVVSPNGGEVWHGGQTKLITWTSTACSVVSSVVLEYSINNGSSWSTIATVANTGAYSWTVPNTSTVQARVRVSGGTVSDMNDVAFTILPTPVPVLTAVQASVTTSSCVGSASGVMVSITLSDPIYPVGSLMLTATSSNQSVVSNGSIVRQGSTSGTTTFLVTANATTSGVSVLIFTASNGFAVSSTTVTLTSTLNAFPVVTLNGSTSACASSVELYSIPMTVGAHYHWTVTGGTIISGQNTPEIIVEWGTAGSGSVAVVATSASSCVASASMNVQINPLPVVTVAASGATTFCPGSSVVLTASPAGMSYLWNNGATTQSITVSESGMFSVTVTNQFGCSTVSTTTTVTVHPGVTVNAGSDVSVCQGTDVQLLAVAGSAIGGVTFSWTPVTGLNNAGIGNPVATPSVTTTYTVVVRDANGCESSDEITVAVVPASATTISSDATICAGGSTELTATGGVSYAWSPATGLSGTTTAVVTASPTTTTTYTVEIGTAGGCVVSRMVTVTVAPIATADAGLDVTVCAGSNTQLVATGGESYEWSPATGLNNAFIANPIASPTTTTTYTVVVRTAAGCESSDEVTVTVLPLVVDLHVQLEGAYTGAEMSTSLRSQDLVPMNQPYNVAPFNYAGTEQMTTTSTAVVDWVLVEVRTGIASNTMLTRKAALLLSDGSIVEGDGGALSIAGINGTASYYIVLHHRNHLGIMSATSVSAGSTCAVVYNFTGSATTAYEVFMSPQKELSTGVWGMVAGDADGNGIVNAVDRVMVRNDAGELGYRVTDLSLDGIVNAVDRVMARNNVFRTNQVP